MPGLELLFLNMVPIVLDTELLDLKYHPTEAFLVNKNQDHSMLRKHCEYRAED